MVRFASAVILILFASLVGCATKRTITINTEPEGALVYLNDQEVGRTPLTRDFTRYGTYDVQIRKEGYETLDTTTQVVAPPWYWPPFDLFSELIGVTDHRDRTFKLEPASTQPADQTIMISRALDLQSKLESSEFSKKPATQPDSAP